MKAREEETGLKWWMRYIVIPVIVACIGSGGLLTLLKKTHGGEAGASETKDSALALTPGHHADQAPGNQQLQASKQQIAVEQKVPDDTSTYREAQSFVNTEPPPRKTPPTYVLTPTAPSTGTSSKYSLVIQECHQAKATIDCPGLVTNLTDNQQDFIFWNGKAADDQGDSYDILYQNPDIKFSGGKPGSTLFPKTPMKFVVSVRDKNPNVKAITLGLTAEFANSGNDAPTFSSIPVQPMEGANASSSAPR